MISNQKIFWSNLIWNFVSLIWVWHVSVVLIKHWCRQVISEVVFQALLELIQELFQNKIFKAILEVVHDLRDIFPSKLRRVRLRIGASPSKIHETIKFR